MERVASARRWPRYLIAAALLATPGALAAQPSPSGYVTDLASILDEADETYLETFLTTLERDTRAEVAVVTLTSLDGVTLEEYASRLFKEWGIGKRQHDNGVLLLVVPDERRVRIEVGYGLESVLPDGLAGEIIRTEIIPEFKASNFPRGIGRGLNRIAQIVRSGPAVPPASPDLPSALIVVPFGATFVFLGAFAAGLGLGTRTVGPLLGGGLFASIPLVIFVASSLVFWAGAVAALGLVPLAAGFAKGRTPYWIGMLRTRSGGTRDDDLPTTWEMGGSGGSSGGSDDSGSSSSSSSSASDFGGGSSGGGGASGQW